VLFLLGVYAPALVAIPLTLRKYGRAETRRLLERVFQWNVHAGWYLFAIAFMPAVKLTVALLHRIVTGAWPRFGTEPWYLMAGALLISTWAQAGEEIGWRGFALPRLAMRVGLPLASLLLGAIWAVWHLPLFFMPGASTFGQSFPLYLFEVTALSSAFAWLYWHTDGSLLLVMLLHASINNIDIVPSAVSSPAGAFTLHATTVGWLTALLLWIAAAFFLFQMRGKTTIATNSHGNYDRNGTS
jgi:uncharacterized protein